MFRIKSSLRFNGELTRGLMKEEQELKGEIDAPSKIL